jgi:hypothetical protein
VLLGVVVFKGIQQAQEGAGIQLLNMIFINFRMYPPPTDMGLDKGWWWD